MTEQLPEFEEMNALKERVAELEKSRELIFQQLRDLKYRLNQREKARMWIEEAENERRPIYGYW